MRCKIRKSVLVVEFIEYDNNTDNDDDSIHQIQQFFVLPSRTSFVVCRLECAEIPLSATIFYSTSGTRTN